MALLEACGAVKEWKPVTEPDSGRLKGFGFVTYEEPEGVVVALQVLNNLKVDGQELMLKCNKATEEYLAWHKAEQQRKKESGGEGA
ncbi:RNA-binding 25 isoform X2, partial [Micractinium conductrix]